MNLEYPTLLILCISIPLWQSFNPRWGLRGKFQLALKAITLSAIPYILWDIIATERGHWSFNPNYVSGYEIVNLPVEEILFFFVIPFCCLFTWNAFHKLEQE